MPPYDDWNMIDEEEDEELQDSSVSRGLSGPPLSDENTMRPIVP